MTTLSRSALSLIALAILTCPLAQAQMPSLPSVPKATGMPAGAPAMPSASALSNAASASVANISSGAVNSAITKAANAAMSQPLVKAAHQKLLDAMSSCQGAITALIGKDSAVKALVDKNPALLNALTSKLSPMLPGAASMLDAELKKQSPATAAVIENFVKTAQADPALLASTKVEDAALKSFTDLLKTTVCQDATVKSLVDKYPAAFATVANSLAKPAPAAAGTTSAK